MKRQREANGNEPRMITEIILSQPTRLDIRRNDLERIILKRAPHLGADRAKLSVHNAIYINKICKHDFVKGVEWVYLVDRRFDNSLKHRQIQDEKLKTIHRMVINALAERHAA